MAETSLDMMHEIYLDVSIRNTGSIFAEEIRGFSVFAYNSTVLINISLLS